MYAPIGLSLFLRESSAQSSNRLGPLGRALSDDVLGAIVATARVIGALVLLFFLPGFLLINALYPRKGELDREYDALYRVTLGIRSEEHTSELQSRLHLVCRLLLEKK